MNRGAEQLKARLAKHGEKGAFVAQYNEGRDEKDQIDQATLSRWIHGKRLPLTLQLRRIEDLTGILMQAWTEASGGDGGVPSVPPPEVKAS